MTVGPIGLVGDIFSAAAHETCKPQKRRKQATARVAVAIAIVVALRRLNHGQFAHHSGKNFLFPQLYCRSIRGSPQPYETSSEEDFYGPTGDHPRYSNTGVERIAFASKDCQVGALLERDSVRL